MKTQRITKMIILGVVVFIILIISLFFVEKYVNEPKRVVESMLGKMVDFKDHSPVAKRYFEVEYLDKIDVSKPATKIPEHSLLVSSINSHDTVTLTFAKSKDGAAFATQVVKFNLKKHGLYPWLYWTRIENVEILDPQYSSYFTSILSSTKTMESKKIDEQFTLSGRFDIAIENFKSLTKDEAQNQINKYSFDIKYKTKPIDFHAMSVFVSLFGVDDMICLKDEKVDISDLSKGSQNVKVTIIGGFCIPSSIQIEGLNIDPVRVTIK